MSVEASADEASWVGSPAWVTAQSAMEAEAETWFAASRESLRADWDAEGEGQDDTWSDESCGDDSWLEQASPSSPDPASPDPASPDPVMSDAPALDSESPPALDDPVSLPLLSHLAQQVPGDMSGLRLVAGLGAWQRFTGFATSRMWLYLAELHDRFTTPARTRLDLAMASGDEAACEKAADKVDLAERSLIAEAACELSWSHLRAQGQLEVALILTTDLVKTLDAVAAGAIEVKKAETIARALARESGDLRVRVQDEVLPHASGWTIPILNMKIREAILQLAPELAAERARWARKQRGVSFHTEPDDMLRMEARMPVEDGIRVRAALEWATATLNASRLPGDDRGVGEIRCDIVTGGLSTLTATESAPGTAGTGTAGTGTAGTGTAGTGTAGTGTAGTGTAGTGTAGTGTAGTGTAGTGTRTGETTPPDQTGDPQLGDEQLSHEQPSDEQPGRPAPDDDLTRERVRRVKAALRHEIVLTVPMETITGDADHPGYLARYGPVSAGIARALALDVARDGYWRCAVTDNEHGTLLGLGRSTFSPTYRPPEFLQRFTSLRDQTCDFPTCTIPAAACDFDHTIPWPEGTTCECGGGKRCRNHHRLKHETSWSVMISKDPGHPPGTVVWTSPNGRQHVRRPTSIGPTGFGPSTTSNIGLPNNDLPGVSAQGSPGAAIIDAANGRAPGPATSGPATSGPAGNAWAYDPDLPDLQVPHVPKPEVAKDDKPPPF